MFNIILLGLRYTAPLEVPMPYPANHRIEVREKIIQSARRLFNRYGFDNVSLQQIMSGAALTHGGFYNYFDSKSDLYAEVLGCFFTDPKVEEQLGGCGDQLIFF